MSDTKIDNEIHSQDWEPQRPIQRNLTTVTLSPEQFESLYLQPRNPRQTGDLSRRFGNPTPLGVSSFLFAHMPLAMDLLNFQGATSASSVAMLGAFYGCAGIGLYLAAIMEWILGNTFPAVVFGTFGGFWISYGVAVQPTFDLAASFATAAQSTNGITAATAGAANRQYNAGLGMYFAIWGIMCVIYFIAALRTNVPFALVFLSLVFAFEFISAGYFHTGQGHLESAARDFKIAGGFAFITGLAGFYIDISLLLAAVDFPISIPLLDLSTLSFMQRRDPQQRKEHEV